MIEIDEAIERIEETKPFIVGQSKFTNAKNIDGYRFTDGDFS